MPWVFYAVLPLSSQTDGVTRRDLLPPLKGWAFPAAPRKPTVIVQISTKEGARLSAALVFSSQALSQREIRRPSLVQAIFATPRFYQQVDNYIESSPLPHITLSIPLV